MTGSHSTCANQDQKTTVPFQMGGVGASTDSLECKRDGEQIHIRGGLQPREGEERGWIMTDFHKPNTDSLQCTHPTPTLPPALQALCTLCAAHPALHVHFLKECRRHRRDTGDILRKASELDVEGAGTRGANSNWYLGGMRGQGASQRLKYTGQSRQVRMRAHACLKHKQDSSLQTEEQGQGQRKGGGERWRGTARHTGLSLHFCCKKQGNEVVQGKGEHNRVEYLHVHGYALKHGGHGVRYQGTQRVGAGSQKLLHGRPAPSQDVTNDTDALAGQLRCNYRDFLHG